MDRYGYAGRPMTIWYGIALDNTLLESNYRKTVYKIIGICMDRYGYAGQPMQTYVQGRMVRESDNTKKYGGSGPGVHYLEIWGIYKELIGD